jgi:energy-coupling factor transport system permease protein
LFLFIFFSVISLVSTKIIYLSAIFIFVFLIFLFNRLPFREIKNFSKFFVVLSFVVVVVQGFFYPLGKTIIFNVVPITLEGLFFGFAISLRLFAILFSLSMLMLTTRQGDLLHSLGNFMPKDIAFSLAIAFRSIPILEEEAKTIIISQEARGLRKRGKKRLAAYFPVIVPLFAKALTRAKYLAMSVEARGFGEAKMKYEMKMAKRDWLVICGTMAFGIACFWLLAL